MTLTLLLSTLLPKLPVPSFPLKAKASLSVVQLPQSQSSQSRPMFVALETPTAYVVWPEPLSMELDKYLNQGLAFLLESTSMPHSPEG